MGDLSPLGLDGDSVVVGVNDFSDLENQVQANTIYQGDITGDEVRVLTTARRVDGTLFQTNVTPAGFGVLNDVGTLFVVDATKVNSLLPLEITSISSQLALRYDANNRLNTTIGATGSTTFALTGTSPTFSFSQSVGIGTATPSARLHLVS